MNQLGTTATDKDIPLSGADDQVFVDAKIRAEEIAKAEAEMKAAEQAKVAEEQAELNAKAQAKVEEEARVAEQARIDAEAAEQAQAAVRAEVSKHEAMEVKEARIKAEEIAKAEAEVKAAEQAKVAEEQAELNAKAQAKAEEEARVAEQARIDTEAAEQAQAAVRAEVSKHEAMAVEEARIKAEEIAKVEAEAMAVEQANQQVERIKAKTTVRAEPSHFDISGAPGQGTLRYLRANDSLFVDRIKGMNRLLLLTVILPTLISSIYFGLIASDVYISESRFVVRSPERQTSTGLGALLQGSSFSRSQDDTYTVHDFIFSRDALKQLDDQFAVGKAFASSNVDIFSRFSGLDRDNSFEALYRYYQKHLTVDLDTLSSISTLSVSAFTPENAYQINEKLLEMSESLVNQLNERGRQDMIRFATAEVATAEQKAKAAALAVSNYRNLKGVFDPEKQSALQLQQVSKLQDELIATKIQLAQIRTLTQDNPQIPALQKQLETLQTEIDSETAKVAGGNRSLANKSTGYESLALERGFAEKQLAAALTSLEQARNDAQRKQLYLERIVQPSKPDVAMEPRRIRNVFATFVLGLIAWGILTMLLAGIREHQD
jgi:capsular polysaccharide transport system permease protein